MKKSRVHPENNRKATQKLRVPRCFRPFLIIRLHSGAIKQFDLTRERRRHTKIDQKQEKPCETIRTSKKERAMVHCPLFFRTLPALLCRCTELRGCVFGLGFFRSQGSVPFFALAREGIRKKNKLLPPGRKIKEGRASQDQAVCLALRTLKVEGRPRGKSERFILRVERGEQGDRFSQNLF